MSVLADFHPAPTVLAQLRTELADLAYELERQGRLDAADVVMQLDARVRELADGAATEGSLHCHCEESRGARDEATHLAGSPRPALPASR
jgi:hypothetical protein